MNCPNCGAAMTLLPERSYFICEFCGSFHFPTPTEDGITVLADAPDPIGCPICSDPMLLVSFDGQHHGHQCPRCRGLLVSRVAFRETIERRRARAGGPASAPQPLKRDQLERRITCPQCGLLMNVHPYYGPGNIVIDSCDICNLIWLDYGELACAVDAPGRDRGDALRPKPRPAPLPLADDEDEDLDMFGRRRVNLFDLLDELFFF